MPIGAVITLDNTVIARAHNMVITNNDPCAHAEIIAIRKACNVLNNYRLVGCSLYVTVEPCMMCLYAAQQSRIDNLYYGAKNYNKIPSYQIKNIYPAILVEESQLIIRRFFSNIRKNQ